MKLSTDASNLVSASSAQIPCSNAGLSTGRISPSPVDERGKFFVTIGNPVSKKRHRQHPKAQADVVLVVMIFAN